jgi:hypothetical protein
MVINKNKVQKSQKEIEIESEVQTQSMLGFDSGERIDRKRSEVQT